MPGKAAESSTGDATENTAPNAAPNTAPNATPNTAPSTAPSTAATATAAGMHMHHVVMPGTMHTTAQYTLPTVDLVRDDGKTVSLVKEVDDGRPVILTFIYTTCTTICPMISQTLERLQGELGPDRDKVHIVSISIDPEQDTPERLKAYAAHFEAGPEWQHYTGTVEASIAAQRAFNVFRGDKMAHTPVTFMRAAPGQPWLRIDGFATPTELLAAYRDVVASN
ncbi:SCO family protein [Burkholderia sp. NLJ2]|uniref:SCO family protein n=1 Tax=Burkholderia sp. NLJ2 TaxID=3090699 RepID=UPI003C6C72CD